MIFGFAFLVALCCRPDLKDGLALIGIAVICELAMELAFLVEVLR